MFQLTAARRRLAAIIFTTHPCIMFQLTAARRRLGNVGQLGKQIAVFQLTAARRRLVEGLFTYSGVARFNSQPPEGGWLLITSALIPSLKFQLTAARRRLGLKRLLPSRLIAFQLTAARRRLANFKRPSE